MRALTDINVTRAYTNINIKHIDQENIRNRSTNATPQFTII